MDSSSSVRDKNSRPSWSVVVTVFTFIAIVATYIGIEYQRANSVERSLKLHHDRIYEVERWQRDWPRTGELNMDVRQNERLHNLEGGIKKLENNVVVESQYVIQRLTKCEAEIAKLKP